MNKGNKVHIIAEIGINHNGSLTIAKKLVKKAKDSGADIAKFQVFNTDLFVAKNAPAAKYQKKNIKNSRVKQYDFLKKLEFSEKNLLKIKKHCQKNNIEFMATPFDRESLKTLIKFKVKKIKVASSDLNNFELLDLIQKTKKPIILSSGLSSINEIKKSLIFLNKKGLKKNKTTLLHCTTSYPTPDKEINLRVLQSFKKLGVKFGYSDHTIGNEAALGAVALGATVIEKHFTLNKNMKGPDHKASADPKQFKELVKSIRVMEMALGEEQKKITPSERKNYFIAKRSIFAMKNIRKGERFTSSNLICLRPASGKSASMWFKYLGKKSKRNYQAGKPI